MSHTTLNSCYIVIHVCNFINHFLKTRLKDLYSKELDVTFINSYFFTITFYYTLVYK